MTDIDDEVCKTQYKNRARYENDDRNGGNLNNEQQGSHGIRTEVA
jgi:hypothetical protein